MHQQTINNNIRTQNNQKFKSIQKTETIQKHMYKILTNKPEKHIKINAFVVC